MMWNLDGLKARQVYISWDTAVKLAWGCPRDTRTYLLQHVLYCGLTSARMDILSRYSRFFTALANSVCKEVRILCNIVSRDLRSTTASNLKLIADRSNADPWVSSHQSVKDGLIRSEAVEINPIDQWRVRYLRSLLCQYQEARAVCHEQQMEYISSLINSLARN